jgi:molybdate-binding protein
MWQALVFTMNRAICLTADEAGYFRIAQFQYAFFIAQQRCNESRVSNFKKYLKVFQTIQNEEI